MSTSYKYPQHNYNYYNSFERMLEMDELLQKLLEAELLTEETKKELQESINAKLEEAVIAARAETEVTVRSELQEQWAEEKETLVEALDRKVEEVLEAEMAELKGDIEKFRDLEAEYAEKLVEARSEMRDELKEDMRDLVNKLDVFLEMRLSTEIKELKEDLEIAKKNDLGRRIVEAFGNEMKSFTPAGDDIAAQLSEAKKALAKKDEEMDTLKKEKEKAKRETKMESLLKNLSGRARDVMEAILKSVPTEKLDEGFDTYLPRIIKESENTTEKEDEVLAERVEDKKDGKKALNEAVVETGDKAAVVTKEKNTNLSESANSELSIWKRLAGLETK